MCLRNIIFDIAEAGLIAMELFPGFSLYRGLYEFSQFSYIGSYMGTKGMQWKDLNNGTNGMKEVMIIITVEWVIVLIVAYYIDQVLTSGRSPLFFLWRPKKNRSSSFQKTTSQQHETKVFVEAEKPDVENEVN